MSVDVKKDRETMADIASDLVCLLPLWFEHQL